MSEPQVFPVKASYELNDLKYTQTPVINPGSWFGQAWVIDMGNGDHYVVEAGDSSSALDELFDKCEAAAESLRIPKEQWAEYKIDTANGGGWDKVTLLGNHGEPCDIENVTVHQLDKESITYTGHPKDLY